MNENSKIMHNFVPFIKLKKIIPEEIKKLKTVIFFFYFVLGLIIVKRK